MVKTLPTLEKKKISTNLRHLSEKEENAGATDGARSFRLRER